MERTQLRGAARAADIALRLIAAGILLQTLFFKFSAAPESVYIFSTLHMEPFGRIASGVAEAVAAVLLLLPLFPWVGGVLAMGVMAGAIASHVFVLGIAVQGDGGLLFALAVIVFLAGAIVTFLHRREWMPLLASVRNGNVFPRSR